MANSNNLVGNLFNLFDMEMSFMKKPGDCPLSTDGSGICQNQLKALFVSKDKKYWRCPTCLTRFKIKDLPIRIERIN